MAITKTTILQSIQIYVASSEHDESSMDVTYVDIWDDPDDKDLPIRKPRSELLKKYVDPDPANMDADRALTDFSEHDQIVQNIAAIIFA